MEINGDIVVFLYLLVQDKINYADLSGSSSKIKFKFGFCFLLVYLTSPTLVFSSVKWDNTT